MAPDLAPDDIPPYLLHGAPTPAEQAEIYREILARTGCTQRALAKLVGRSQSHVSKRLKYRGYRPPPLPPRTTDTDPRGPAPPAGPHRLLELWCAYRAEDLGWQVAREHHLPSQDPARSDLKVDLVLSPPGPWRPAWAIEVKPSISTSAQLASCIAQRDAYSERLDCPGLLVTATAPPRRLDRRDGVVLAHNLHLVVGFAPGARRRRRRALAAAAGPAPPRA